MLGKRVLVYKRTHNGDPGSGGCFGAYNCMGKIRDWDYDAVIGVGGNGSQAEANGIDRKVNWIGIGPHKTFVRNKRWPEVTFDHFLDYKTHGPDFQKLAPTLAKRMYSKNVRVLMDGRSEKEYLEELKILELAKNALPSSGRVAQHDRTCPPSRCVGKCRVKKKGQAKKKG